MNFRHLTALLLLLLASHTYAQIKGKVVDAQKVPVSFATVVLRSLPDSVVLKTELTDTGGNYSIAGANKYPALISIFADGFTHQSQQIDSRNFTADFTLVAAVSDLQSVTVSAQKRLIERKIDRTVFNVQSSISSIGSDAFEALKKAPGVRTNDGTIAIAGKSSVSVMINDRLLQLSGDELESMLRSIPADDISYIEVITSPPAKYDAQGNSGIINIVTRKQAKNGFNGNITASHTQRIRASEGIEGAFNWRQGKLNVYGNGNSNWFKFSSDQRIATFYPSQEQQLHFGQVNTPWFYRADVGADYDLNERSMIGVLYTNGNLDKNVDQSYNTNVSDRMLSRIDSVMASQTHTKEYGHRDVINLNYEWKIDSTGKKLDACIDYFDRKGNTFRTAAMQNYYADGTGTGFTNTNTTYGYNNVLMKDAKLDILLPFKLATFSFGGKVSLVQNNSASIYSNVYGQSSVLDPSRTDHFIYSEDVQALYLSLQRIWGKWEAKAGLRGENTSTKAISIALNETNTNNYFKLFPTAYLQYKMDNDHVFGITYSRRIERPDLWVMNPFREYLTYNSYEQGNPFLQPSFSNNVEANFTYKSNYTITLFTQQVRQDVARLAVTDTMHNYYYFIEANAGTVKSYGTTIAASFNPFDWWEGNAQAFGYYNIFSSSYYGQSVQYARASFSLEMSNSFILNTTKTFLAEVGFNYTSMQQTNFEVQRSEFFVYGAVKALFFKKQLTVALSVEDPFRTNLDRLHNLYNGTTENNYFDSREAQLAVTWKFGNRYIKNTREHKVSDDAKRLK